MPSQSIDDCAGVRLTAASCVSGHTKRPRSNGLAPGPGLLARVAVSKCAEGLPLHCQSEIYARQGGRARE